MPTTVLWPLTTSFISVQLGNHPRTVFGYAHIPATRHVRNRTASAALPGINEHVASLCGSCPSDGDGV
jgi:hypothetical protein